MYMGRLRVYEIRSSEPTSQPSQIWLRTRRPAWSYALGCSPCPRDARGSVRLRLGYLAQVVRGAPSGTHRPDSGGQMSLTYVSLTRKLVTHRMEYGPKKYALSDVRTEEGDTGPIATETG